MSSSLDLAGKKAKVAVKKPSPTNGSRWGKPCHHLALSICFRIALFDSMAESVDVARVSFRVSSMLSAVLIDMTLMRNDDLILLGDVAHA